MSRPSRFAPAWATKPAQLANLRESELYLHFAHDSPLVASLAEATRASRVRQDDSSSPWKFPHSFFLLLTAFSTVIDKNDVVLAAYYPADLHLDLDYLQLLLESLHELNFFAPNYSCIEQALYKAAELMQACTSAARFMRANCFATDHTPLALTDSRSHWAAYFPFEDLAGVDPVPIFTFVHELGPRWIDAHFEAGIQWQDVMDDMGKLGFC